MPLKGRTYETRSEKRRDLLIGFFGWFLINGLIWVPFIRMPDFLIVSFPLNVIALIILAFLRRWISLGMLAAFALNLAIELILGLGWGGACFGVPFFAPASLPGSTAPQPPATDYPYPGPSP